MSCPIISGYTKACRDSFGGIKTVYLTNLEDIDATTLAFTTGKITTLDCVSTKQFFEYEQIKHTSNFDANIQADDATGTLAFEHLLNLFFNKAGTATRNQIMLLAQSGGLVAIVEDGNGVLWVLGLYNGLTVSGGKHGTGTQPTGERNGYDLVLRGLEKEAPYELDSTLLAALLTPAA